MIRFILKREISALGVIRTDHYTLEADVPELEDHLRRGGRTENVHETNTLIGVEIYGNL